MNFEILCETYDKVLSSNYLVIKTSLEEANKELVPIISRFKEQRYTLNSKVYEKLKVDLEKGCVMPPLTIAFKSSKKIKDYMEYIQNNISSAFVLDGIQRLNTIKRIFTENPSFVSETPIFVNVLIADSMDKLLYRMVTLNNGQKPMSTRHQIEILASSLYKFETLPIIIQSEKEQKQDGKQEFSFTKENIIKAYMSFISNSYNLDNQKIIDEKMDELITNKIIDANLPMRNIEFNDVINLISRFSAEPILYKWFSNNNNMMGFCSSINKMFNFISGLNNEAMIAFCEKMDVAISEIKRSKINLGSFRRKSVNHAILNAERFIDASSDEILFEISDF